MDKKIVLIDGHSILNRAFYGVPDLTNFEGLHTNAVYGFINILFKILEEEQPEYVTIAFDRKEPTFRHDRYEAYKGTRKPMPNELREQVPLIKEVLQAMGIKTIERPGYEADDIIGTIAKRSEQAGYDVAVVSGDRDLLQLATDRIKIRMPKTKHGVTEVEDFRAQEVLEKYQITPLQIIDLKGLMGDASDNIPGVPGIGEKTATKIINQFGTVENAYAHIDEVMPNRARESLRENYNLAELSKELATIKIDCELDYNIEDAQVQNFFSEEAFQLLKRLEFKSLLTKFQFDRVEDLGIEELFQVVTDKNEADSILEGFLKVPPVYCGLQLIDEGMVLCWVHEEKEFVYYFKSGDQMDSNYFAEKLTQMLSGSTVFGMLDLKSQLQYFSFNEENKLFDLSVAAYLLNPMKDTYHYDDLARDFLELSIPSYGELFGKTKIAIAPVEKEKEYISYRCYEAYVACKGIAVLQERLNDANMMDLFNEIEMPLIFTLFDMESRGIKVNKEELQSYGQRLQIKIQELETTIYELVGEKFNINSPKQLGIILFEKLKLPFAKKTKTGYSTSADILEKLKCEDPVISMVLEYRQLTKLKSTYADGLANYIHEDDMRIHGKFNQTIAATGRISSTEPNLQNIPVRMEIGREIRKVFIPEKDFVFLDADYSQIELRVLAHMSGDEILIDAYKQEQDIHKITASQVFHTPLEEVTSEQRSNAKAVNFGIVYGISSFGLGQDLNITRKEAESYISKYFNTFPRVKEFLDELVDSAKKNGYVTTLFHRRRPVPEISSSNFMQRSFGERIAMNSPIQGSAADIIKLAMIRVNQALKNKKYKSRLLLQIHDELLIEAHKDEIDEVAKILKEEMYHAASLSVPLDVEVNQGNSWYEVK